MVGLPVSRGGVGHSFAGCIAPRACVYDNLRSVVARRDGETIPWNPRFVALRGHSAFHPTACTPATPREKGAVEARSGT